MEEIIDVFEGFRANSKLQMYSETLTKRSVRELINKSMPRSRKRSFLSIYLEDLTEQDQNTSREVQRILTFVSWMKAPLRKERNQEANLRTLPLRKFKQGTLLIK